MMELGERAVSVQKYSNAFQSLKFTIQCREPGSYNSTERKAFRFLVIALFARYLRRSIQGSKHGHNSSEDAIAALELAQLKISKGPTFGAERRINSVFDIFHRCWSMLVEMGGGG